MAVPAGGSGLLRSKTTHGSSRFKGVSWSVRSGKWRAQMWLGAKVRPHMCELWLCQVWFLKAFL